MIAFKTMACWSDLLGFGDQLDASDWQLDEKTMSLVGNRLTKFASRIYEMAANYEQGSFINDALIRTLDNGYYLSLASKWVVRTWLDSCIMAHCMTAQEEASQGLPGIRTIICEGEVLKYEMTTESFQRMPFQSIHPILTQLNTALSKCYIADSKGSREIGLKRGGVYLEQSVIDHLIAIFGYQQKGEYLFTYDSAVYLDDVIAYDSVKELYFIEDPHLRDEAGEGDHRSPWFKLGDKKPVVHKNLKYELVEVLAYSPIVEFSLCWHDCFTGDCSGISCSVTPDLPREFRDATKAKVIENEAYEIVKKYMEEQTKVSFPYVKEGTSEYKLLLKVLKAANPAMISDEEVETGIFKLKK